MTNLFQFNRIFFFQIEECWKEEPDERPDFRFINIRLREMQAGLYEIILIKFNI